MSAADNKRLLQYLFAEYGKGNTAPFRDSFADDIVWTAPGTNPVVRRLHGQESRD